MIVSCVKCKARNIIRLGPVLIAQTSQRVDQFPLKEGVNKIGRIASTSEADIKIQDKYVSRQQAEIIIEKINNKLFVSIRDNGSLNGTFNRQKQRLQPGVKYPFSQEDYFIIGLTKLMFKFN